MTSLISMRRAAAFALLVATGSAVAEPSDSGWYVEANIGRTHFNLEKSGLDHWSQVPDTASSFKRGDTGWALAGGIRFSPLLAIEAGLLDLGETKYLVQDKGSTATLKLGSRGPTLSLIVTWPIYRMFWFEGRAGMYWGYPSVKLTPVAPVVAGFLTLAELNSYAQDPHDLKGGSDPGWLIGAGAAAALGDHWSIRVGYDYFDGKAASLRDPVHGTELDSRAGRWKLGLRYAY
jgi:opacity protein-like surface antigen